MRLFLVVSTSAIGCLERLVSEMTHYVSSATLNPTHALTHSLYAEIRPIGIPQCRHIYWMESRAHLFFDIILYTVT